MASAQSGVSGEFEFTYTRVSDLIAIANTINDIKDATDDSTVKISKLTEYFAKEETQNAYIIPSGGKRLPLPLKERI